ncbi:hypothetical protein V6N13_093255 [Hibiscus sabdariffa]
MGIFGIPRHDDFELLVDGCISMLDLLLDGSQFYAFLVSSTGTSMVVSVPYSSLESVYQYCHMGTGTVREWYRYCYIGTGTVRDSYQYCHSSTGTIRH